MNIPTKFTFFNRDNLLKLTNINGDYYCTLPHVEADTISSAVYDRINVEHKLTTGKWKIVADLTLPEKEPEMKFPFTFKCKGYEQITYTALKGDGTDLYYDFEGSLGGPYPISVKNAKQSIEDGFWIIQSVGEQEAKEELAKVETFSPITENSVHTIRVDGSVTSNKLTVENLSSMSVKLEIANFEESFAKLESFKEKVELTIKAVEKLSELLESLGIGGCVVQTFCCGDE